MEVSQQQKSEMKTLFEEFIKWRLQMSPEFSTSVGFHEHDARLESYSLETFQECEIQCKEFLEKAKSLLPSAKDTNDEENCRLFMIMLQIFLDGAKYNGYAAPINYFEGPQVELEQIISYMPKETTRHFKNIIARYKAFPKQADEIIELMKYGMSRKTTLHSSSMKGVLKQFADLQVPVEKSIFFGPFLSIPDSILLSERTELHLAAKTAVGDFLLPAFNKLSLFIENEYMHSFRPKISAASLPDGKRYYAQLLRHHLSCDMAPEDVHAVGLREVERISAEMKKVIHSLGMKMTVREFSEKIRGDRQFYFSDKDSLLQAYKVLVHKEIIPKLSSIFNYIPNSELSIEAQRDSQAGGPLAYYLAGSQDGSRPGVFYCNLSDLDAAPSYEMMSLALHEGLPGHHLQCSYLLEAPNIPRFRRYMEDRKYCMDPAAFPMYSAFVEGWGLYSEYLGEELGLYKDPYILYGRLSQEIFRACRLVVDTGMHVFGWSMQKAIDFMLTHTAKSNQDIEKEINRYILWPAQACAYKIGELKIKELRQKAEKALGEKFDIRQFHDILLKSSGPLSFVEEQVLKFISS